MPKISVIMPVYNGEQTLAQCLDSVLGQTLCDIEVICVDDCSSDRSPEILKEYAAKDSRLNVIHHSINRGTFMARKHAALASVGEYVMFIDQDDEYVPDACEKALAAITRNNVDFIQFGTKVVDCSDNYDVSGIQELYKHTLGQIEGNLLEIAFFTGGGKKRPFGWTLWNKIYRGDIIRNAYVQAKDTYAYIEDDLYVFFFILRLSRSYAGIPDELYRYNRGRGFFGNNFTSLKKFTKSLTQKNTFDLILTACRENEEEGKNLLTFWNPSDRFFSIMSCTDG